MLIYAKEITTRIEYIFSLILNEMLGIDLTFTNDFGLFNSYDGPKINYSSQPSKEGWFLSPAELLFESTIKEQAIEVINFNGVKVFYETSKNAEIPFDLFAASFYLISRYEEYLPFKADDHGRFPATESIAFKNDFLHQPVINIWVENLKQVLLKHYPDLKIKTSKYEFINTVDVDNGFAYLGKSWWRTLGAFTKYFLKFDFKKISERLLVLSGFKRDPFNQYDFQQSIQAKYNFPSIYFLLCGKPSKNDHNILPHSHVFKTLINLLKGFAQIGVHPSYMSNKYPEKVKLEKQLIEKISGRKIIKSRQHFLKLKFPETYSILLKAGIEEDYSMGYASHPGFRAGICTPFKFYDLKQEKKTGLTVFPFAIMDVTFSDYMNLNSDEIIPVISPIIKEVKKVNGLLITVWHDRNFTNHEGVKDWRKIYEEMVKDAMVDKAKSLV